MNTTAKREAAPLKAGMIWRHKANTDDFASELYIGTGDSIDNYEQVPVSVYEKHRAEQEAKAREQMMQ